MKKLSDKVRMMTDTSMLMSITIIVFVLMYLGAMIFEGGGFLKPQTFFNMLNTNASLIIVSLGLSIVMINGSIDISVGGVVCLVCMSCAVNLDMQGGNVVTAFLIALGIGLAYGVIQGLMIAYLDIQPFIVTLAGMFFAKGLTTIIYSKPFNVQNEQFVALKDTRIRLPFIGSYTNSGKFINSYVEIGVIIALVLVLVMFLLLRYSKMGRNFYAVGGNSQSALMLGINVKKTKFLAHVLCGVLAGIGGFVYFMHVGSGSASNAGGMEMNAIASSIIGGTLLTGGVGNLIGTFFGVLSLSTIKDIVASAGLDDAWWIGITVAGMLCIFLVIQSIIMAYRKKSVKK